MGRSCSSSFSAADRGLSVRHCSVYLAKQLWTSQAPVALDPNRQQKTKRLLYTQCDAAIPQGIHSRAHLHDARKVRICLQTATRESAVISATVRTAIRLDELSLYNFMHCYLGLRVAVAKWSKLQLFHPDLWSYWLIFTRNKTRDDRALICDGQYRCIERDTKYVGSCRGMPSSSLDAARIKEIRVGFDSMPTRSSTGTLFTPCSCMSVN